MAMMRLLHFTAPTTHRLGGILADGRINVTDANISGAADGVVPDVVWLTDLIDPRAQHWASEQPLKIMAILVVELPEEDVHPWREWAEEHGADPLVLQGLAETGGDDDSWFVVTEPVRRANIKAIVLAPLRPGEEERRFAQDELDELFESADARKALGLRHVEGEGR